MTRITVGFRGFLDWEPSWFLVAALVASQSLTSLAADAPDYRRDIRPVLADHCFQCHGTDGAKRQAGLRLDVREGATSRLESGATAIRPGQVDESELVRRIESSDPAVMMPPPETKRPLTAGQKQMLRQWIEAGAPYSGHWAYVKPVRPALPAVLDQAWPRNAIDSFVQAKLEAARLHPSLEATPQTLIRRLSLDLTGLPPTLDEVELFLQDKSPGAYERLVDRLLASPHCGEKLAQDWLDLARFGDSSGYQDDGDRPNSPYRDYVIDAFNANMPFDQFTLENLAGDLLPNATLAQKVASGFSRLHRHNEEGGSDPDEFQVVYAVDRATTTATTWLGLTFGCAQCHDHKYDPFTQREFYEFYAFFNSLKGEVVISKAPSPPQIRVPGEDDQRRLTGIVREIFKIEGSRKELQSRVDSAFKDWLKEKASEMDSTTSSAASTNLKPGAIGGSVARSIHPAFYADTRLEASLTLEQSIRGSGSISIVRSVNNIVDIGHFSSQAVKGEAIGFSVAEGPRFFAFLSLTNGTRVVAGPITVEHGVEYLWDYHYDPAAGTDDPADADSMGEGLLIFDVQRAGKSVGSVQIDLNAAQRLAAAKFSAFGISYRGASNADSPIDLYVDNVVYTVSGSGQTRRQTFADDPGWTGDGNGTNGHLFGFDSAATTSGGAATLTVEQILALPARSRTSLQIARVRERFVAEQFPELSELDSRLTALNAHREAIQKSAPLALVWEEMEVPRPARILVRGDYQRPSELVERNVPAIFPRLPAGPRDRLAVARWLVSGEHPLTARVTVNRLWKQCFGAGLVRTPEDFGVRGELPTHPELLDWLAVEFQGSDGGAGWSTSAWDLKRLLRSIVTSATYRQSSAFTPQLREVDPDNRLLARGSRFRLSAEEIRDGALTAASLLTRRIGGRSVYPYQPDHFYRDKEDDPGEWKWPLETGSELYRRGLYTFLRRTTPYPSYLTFDAPSRGECTVARSRTNTPLQALVTMNDPVFVEAARFLGEQIAMYGSNNEDRVSFAFRSVLSRAPTSPERKIANELFDSERVRYSKDPQAAADVARGKLPRSSDRDPIEVAAWTAVATALLNLDESITRE